MIDDKAVWFITGCSTGLGRALAEHVLETGYRAVVTARDPDQVADIVKGHSDRALVLPLDVTKPNQVKAAIAQAERRFSGIDVLVNNAGYGYIGGIEEGEDADVRACFETNVFGPLAMIQAVLPGMRERRRGHIVNLSSIGGLVTFPAVGFYHATKFAIEGLSETLAKEVAPFGIGVTIVEPGAFRTDFRGRSMRTSTIRLPEYEATLGKARDALLAGHGTQENDPQLGAEAIVTALEAEKPPLHLLLGADALEKARQKLDDFRRDFDAWEDLTRGTRFRELEHA